MNQETEKFILPSGLIGPVELAELTREIEVVDADMEAQRVRMQDNQGYTLPPISRTLSEFLDLNKIDITDGQTRMVLKERLRDMKKRAPVMHLTFAVPADPESLAKLVTWIRQELHPWALMSVGLQPGLIGGVYIRTPNHVHDLSMRSLFKGKTDVLMHDLEELAHAG